MVSIVVTRFGDILLEVPVQRALAARTGARKLGLLAMRKPVVAWGLSGEHRVPLNDVKDQNDGYQHFVGYCTVYHLF